MLVIKRKIGLPVCLLIFIHIFSTPLKGEERIKVENSDQSLGKDLNAGSFEFHKRSYYMQTQNKGALSNYNTLASGAGLGYYSPSWKGFHLGFSGFFVFQLFEKNIHIPDSITRSINRYEILLYDMNDPSNKGDLDRLEELYLRYEKNNWSVIWGRHKFESPFLNEQDNRMRPNIFSGLYSSYESESLRAGLAWFNAVTIRGTVDWYSIGESYGVYPFGRSPFGVSSDYKGNIQTKGIGIAHIGGKTTSVDWGVWNYFNENVFNFSFAQVEKKWQIHGVDMFAGLQGGYQTAINNGGNPDPVKAYILPDEKTGIIGGKWGMMSEKFGWDLNYNTFRGGRFLFPREWGREQFFASLPRERFEGNGNLNAWTMKGTYFIIPQQWYVELGASRVLLSEINDYRYNKYGIPSYDHVALTMDYRFGGYWQGLDLKLIAVYKRGLDKDIPNEWRINRVDLSHLSVVADYRF
jgi:hypothetical protein